MKSSTKRTALLAAVGLLLLFALAIGLLLTPYATRLAFDQARAYLRNNYHVELTAARTDLELSRGVVRLRDAVIVSLEAPDLPPVLKIGELHLNVGLRPLLQGRFETRNSRVSGVAIQVFIATDGRTNLPRPADPGPFRGLPNVLIESFSVDRASLHIDDRVRGYSLELPDWAVRISGDPEALTHHVRAYLLRPGTLNANDRTVPVDQFDADAVLSRSDVLSVGINLRAAQTPLQVHGSIRDLGNPVLDLTAAAAVDAQTLFRLTDARKPIAGVLNVEARVTGHPKSAVISGRIAGDPVSAFGYDRMHVASDYRYAPEELQLNVDRLEIRSGQGVLKARGVASFRRDRESSFGMTVEGWDLSPLAGLAGARMRLASRATATLNGSWPGLEFEKAIARGRIRFVPSSSQPGLNTVPLAGSVALEAVPGSIRVSLDGLSAVGAQLSGQVGIQDQQRLSGDVRGNVAAVDHLQDQVRLLLGRRQPLIPVYVGGAATFSARLGGTVESPSANASVESTDLTVGNLKGVTFSAQSDLTPDAVTVRDLAASAGNQALRASGTVGLRGEDPALVLDAAVEKGSLPVLLAAAGLDVPAGGTFEATAHIRGTLRRPSGDMTLSGSDLSVRGQQLGTLDAAADLDAGVIRTSRLVLQRDPGDHEKGYLTASGSYTLASGRLEVNADARGFSLPEGSPVIGTVSGRAAGSGTRDNPSLDVSLSMSDGVMRDQALGPVSLTAAIRGESGDIQAEAPTLNLYAIGRIGTRAPYPAELRLDLRNADISTLKIPVAEQEFLAGNIVGYVTAAGDLQNWRGGKASLLLESVHLTARSHELRNDGPVDAGYRLGSVSVRHARFVVGASSLAIAGTVPVLSSAPGGNLSMNGALDLADLYPFLNTPPGFSAGGLLKTDMSLQGTPRQMSVSGGFSMSDGSVQLPRAGVPLTGISVDASLRNGALLVRSAQARWGPGRILFSGEIPLGLVPDLPFRFERKQGTAQFDLALSEFKLEATGKVPEGVGGALDVRIHGELPRPDLESLNAVATVDRLQVNSGELLFEQEGRSTVTVQDGIVRIGQLAIQGPGTRVEMSGTAGLTGNRPLALRLAGNVDAGIFSVFTQEFQAAGNTQLEVSATGTVSAPALSGFVQLQGGQVIVRSVNTGADDLNATLRLSGHRISVENLAGTLNGGVLSGQGTVDYSGTDLTNVDLGFHLDGVYIGYPEGLRAIANGDLTVTSNGNPIVVGGTVLVQEGSYSEPANTPTGILGSLRSAQAVDISAARNPLLARVRYNVAVRTAGPLSTNSNMFKVAAHANLKVVGTYYRPAVTGRATFEEGGEIRLNERTYVIDHGSISFINESRIEPVLDIEGRTQVAGFDIDLKVNGTPENPKTTLTSDPPLSEPDILSLLLTGRTQEEFRGEELQFAKEQALSLITGEAGVRISQGAQRVLGLSTVRIEPNLISPESDPGARLTVGENLTKELRLIYSMNLVNSNDQIWIGEYDVTRRFITRALKQQDNTYRFEFQHDLRFGGSPGSGRVMRFDRSRRDIGQISFKGPSTLTDEQLMSQMKLKPGDRYDFAKVQKGRERLRDYFAEQDRVESKVSVSRTGKVGNVDLTLSIAPGPRVRFFYEGANISGSVKGEVARVWHDGIFDLQRVQDSVQAIRRSLVADGYLQPDVKYRIEQEGDMKNVHFMVRPGTLFHGVQLVFSGNSGIDSSELLKQIKAAKMENAVYNDPFRLVDLLTNYYRTQGYTHAKVENPKLHLDPARGSGQVQIVIQEGPQFRIGNVTFEGITVSDNALRRESGLTVGTLYTSTLVDDALDKIDRFYHNRGYNDATYDYDTLLDDATGKANVVFRIQEHRRDVIRHIVIEGNERSPTSFVRKLLVIAEGDTLDADKLARSRRALYDSGVFSAVDFETQPVDLPSAAAGTKPVDVTLRLREIKPYRLRYGGFYDTDRGAGFSADISNRNFLGRAATIGLHARYDGTMKEGRLYFGEPFFRGIPLNTNVTGFVQRESRPAYTLDRAGASLVQEKQLRDHYLLNYGYRYERVKAPQGLPDPLLRLTSTVPLARLALSITRDTRDDILDATRGSFNSQAFEYAPGFLGGDARFAKYFGQYFRYIPLGDPERLSRRTISRFVYAGAIRVGLSKGLGGQTVITPERFFAGGGTTLRGFRQDTLGPFDTNGRPFGGEALFLLNNEIRHPLFKIFDGVGFLDVGNVYPTVRDFNPFDVRKSAGVGLRIRTGYVVIRVDYGVKLDRKAGESHGALFFSIGQAY